jgi:hypothetical protein
MAYPRLPAHAGADLAVEKDLEQQRSGYNAPLADSLVFRGARVYLDVERVVRIGGTAAFIGSVPTLVLYSVVANLGVGWAVLTAICMGLSFYVLFDLLRVFILWFVRQSEMFDRMSARRLAGGAYRQIGPLVCVEVPPPPPPLPPRMPSPSSSQPMVVMNHAPPAKPAVVLIHATKSATAAAAAKLNVVRSLDPIRLKASPSQMLSAPTLRSL